MRPAWGFLALAACRVPSAAVTPEPRLADLWAGAYTAGATITFEAIVTSPRAVAGGWFTIQDPGGGPSAAARVRTLVPLAGFAPPLGTRVSVRGEYQPAAFGPELVVFAEGDVETLGPSVAVPAPWADDPALAWQLTTAPGITVTSDADPAGHADTDAGFGFEDSFDVRVPGWNAAGDATGIVVAPGRVALRQVEDWTGPMAGDPAVVATAAELPGLAEGTPVALDAAQVAPWSDGDRWTVAADAGGGVWIDGESWQIGDSKQGDAGIWSGEVRTDGDGLRLRAWTPLAVSTEGEPAAAADTPVAAWEDGAVVTATAAGLGPVTADGERATNSGFLLDDRFIPLGELSDPAFVTGAVRVTPEGEVRLSPWSWSPG